MDDLDAASLRRFDFRVFFDYLDDRRAWLLFNSVLCEQGKDPGQVWARKLRSCRNLTPGDFATVARQAALYGEALTAETLFAGLVRESTMKQASRSQGIGFLAAL